MFTASPLRRMLIAIGMVGSPICLALGNLLLTSPGSTDTHSAIYLTGSVIDAAGFALLGAFGVGVAVLLPARGGVLATIGAVLTVIGGVVMGGAVLTTAFVQAAIPTAIAPRITSTLESDPRLGTLFEFALVAAVGGVLGAIALIIGRPVPLWISIVLIIGILMSSAGGGVLGAALTLPFLVADALLARALVRTSPGRATTITGTATAAVVA